MTFKKKLAVVFAFVIGLVIFGISMYLVLKREYEKENPNVATSTDASAMSLASRIYIYEDIIKPEPVTEQLTTQEVTTEQPTTEAPTTEEITTEEVTEDYIYEETTEEFYEEVYEEYEEPEEDSYDSAPEEYVDNGGMTYMGTWDVSAYEWSDQPCANGNWPTAWYTCAFNDAPIGATVYIEGLGYFVNEDICGTPSRVDIYLGDYDACIQFGVQRHDVYIVN